MKLLTNIISLIAGLTIIFGIYSGKFIWILIGVIPLLIIVAIIFLEQRKIAGNTVALMTKEIEQLKRSGEKISVDLDNCEFKDSSYSQDIIDERMTRFSHINLDYGKVIGQEHIDQSLLIYNYSGSNGSEKFIQAFPFGKEYLKVNVIRNQIILYVDRYDRTKYIFDLKSE
ncbi:MAG: hypothetical protein H6549_12240 [Chitinophagales bacterium]|nr:hypothetical protein [Chitinophagales bacterium]